MAFINILQGGYRGKLGETVGQKWNKDLILKTYNPHNTSNSSAQIDQRAHYKILIERASQSYMYADTVIPPKGKAMSRFNSYTSLLEYAMSRSLSAGTSFPWGVYSKSNIASPVMGIKDNAAWLYVFAESETPEETLKKLKETVFWGRFPVASAILPEGKFLLDEIYPRKMKPGVLSTPAPRGFFVKTSMALNKPGPALVSIGKRRQGKTLWSNVLVAGMGIQINENTTEPL